MNKVLSYFTRAAFSLLLLGCLAAPQFSRAQVSLGISSLSGISDSLQEGDSAMVSFTINNYGPSNFNGSFTLNTYLKKETHALIYCDSVYFQNFFIPAFGSIPVTVPFRIRTPNTQPQGNMRIGNNVIVVWPRSYEPGHTTADSLIDSVYIAPPLSVQSPYDRSDKAYFFYNSAHQQLFLLPGPDLLFVNRVTVSDVLGRTLFVYEGHPLTIDVAQWKNDLYLIDVDFGNNERRTYKVIKR